MCPFNVKNNLRNIFKFFRRDGDLAHFAGGEGEEAFSGQNPAVLSGLAACSGSAVFPSSCAISAHSDFWIRDIINLCINTRNLCCRPARNSKRFSRLFVKNPGSTARNTCTASVLRTAECIGIAARKRYISTPFEGAWTAALGRSYDAAAQGRQTEAGK